MAKVGLKRAAELTGKSPSTIHRAAKAGRLSCEVQDDGDRLFDTSELERVFGPLQADAVAPEIARDMPRNQSSNDTQPSEIAVLRAKLDAAQDRIRDLETDRDAWRDQAKQLARLAPPPDGKQDADLTGQRERRGLLSRIFGRV